MEKIKRNIIKFYVFLPIFVLISCSSFNVKYYEGFRENKLRMVIKLEKKYDKYGEERVQSKESIHNQSKQRAEIFLKEYVNKVCGNAKVENCDSIISQKITLENFNILKNFYRDDNLYALVEYNIGPLESCCQNEKQKDDETDKMMEAKLDK